MNATLLYFIYVNRPSIINGITKFQVTIFNLEKEYKNIWVNILYFNGLFSLDCVHFLKWSIVLL